MLLEKENVSTEYDKLINLFYEIANVENKGETYEILNKYYISNLLGNFEVLKYLLKNEKNYGYYEIVRANFEICIILLFILKDNENIDKKMKIYEYLRATKAKYQIEEKTYDGIKELFQIKKLNFPYNINSFESILNLETIDEEINNYIINIKNTIDLINETIQKYSSDSSFSEDLFLIKKLKIQYPSFYNFSPNKIKIKKPMTTKEGSRLNKKSEFDIKKIEINSSGEKFIKIKNGTNIETINYDSAFVEKQYTLRTIKQLCKFLEKEDYYVAVYEITSSIIHCEFLEFKEEFILLKNTTIINNILVCEIIKKLSQYFLSEEKLKEIDEKLREILGVNYPKIENISII